MASTRIEPCFTGRPVRTLVIILTELPDSSTLLVAVNKKFNEGLGGGEKERKGKPKKPEKKRKKKKKAKNTNVNETINE